jgi:hypothetical protein
MQRALSTVVLGNALPLTQRFPNRIGSAFELLIGFEYFGFEGAFSLFDCEFWF